MFINSLWKEKLNKAINYIKNICVSKWNEYEVSSRNFKHEKKRIKKENLPVLTDTPIIIFPTVNERLKI